MNLQRALAKAWRPLDDDYTGPAYRDQAVVTEISARHTWSYLTDGLTDPIDLEIGATVRLAITKENQR